LDAGGGDCCHGPFYRKATEKFEAQMHVLHAQPELLDLQKDLIRNQIRESQLNQEYLMKQIQNFDEEHTLVKRSLMLQLEKSKDDRG
jgi:hypothetical protein